MCTMPLIIRVQIQFFTSERLSELVTVVTSCFRLLPYFVVQKENDITLSNISTVQTQKQYNDDYDC